VRATRREGVRVRGSGFREGEAASRSKDLVLGGLS
jgi:hypothetical protein